MWVNPLYRVDPSHVISQMCQLRVDPTDCGGALTISMALIMNNVGGMVALCSKKLTGTSKMVETLINSLSDFEFRMEPLQMVFWR